MNKSIRNNGGDLFSSSMYKPDRPPGAPSTDQRPTLKTEAEYKGTPTQDRWVHMQSVLSYGEGSERERARAGMKQYAQSALKYFEGALKGPDHEEASLLLKSITDEIPFSALKATKENAFDNTFAMTALKSWIDLVILPLATKKQDTQTK